MDKVAWGNDGSQPVQLTINVSKVQAADCILQNFDFWQSGPGISSVRGARPGAESHRTCVDLFQFRIAQDRKLADGVTSFDRLTEQDEPLHIGIVIQAFTIVTPWLDRFVAAFPRAKIVDRDSSQL
jgi:hypothetical protein